MSDSVTSKVSVRAGEITRRINLDFRDLDSRIRYSLYVGSYGRGTDIHVSDVDVIVELPYSVYQRYDAYQGNGQYGLIKAVRESIARTYSTTYIRGDGQVVKLDFSDKICFEIVPGFLNDDKESFTYPDTNDGGSWRVTNPRAEIKAINLLNTECNKNLKRLCRMARAWKDVWSVPMSGWLIDTLAYKFLQGWQYKTNSYVYYDWMVRDFFYYLKELSSDQEYWLAPGSYSRVPNSGYFQYKALRCYNISVEAIKDENEYPYLAHGKWQEIFGNKFPGSPS